MTGYCDNNNSEVHYQQSSDVSTVVSFTTKKVVISVATISLHFCSEFHYIVFTVWSDHRGSLQVACLF